MNIGTTISNINWWCIKHLQLYCHRDSVRHGIHVIVNFVSYTVPICICGYCLILSILQQSITQLHYQLNSNSTYNISLKATSMIVCNRKQHSEECLKINAVQGKALHTLEILLWMLWTPDTPHVINMYKLYFSCGPFYSNSYGLAKIISAMKA